MSEEDFNKLFARNLNTYLSKYDYSQAYLAQKLNVSAQSVSNWCKGKKTPRMDKVDLICKIFNCRRSDLMEDNTVINNIKAKKAISINVLGRVAAGIPINAIEEIIDTEEIPEDLARTGSFFGLKIKGNSMEPYIFDNDVVIVKQQEEAESGDIVIAMVNGDDAVCKRLKLYSDKLALISINSEYDPMIYTNEDVEQKPVKIIGKVVEIRRKL